MADIHMNVTLLVAHTKKAVHTMKQDMKVYKGKGTDLTVRQDLDSCLVHNTGLTLCSSWHLHNSTCWVSQMYHLGFNTHIKIYKVPVYMYCMYVQYLL